MSAHDHDDETSARRRASYQAMAVAWSLGWPIAAGVLIGSWLDGYFDTSPVFILVFGVGALGVAVRQLLMIGTGAPRRRDRT
ncbi:MAG TPA: AtpZ/AtpI family protein [Candidatus Binatia bacterium]|nr:AtpZ/AtpI family protein [Candidatus Binatia bacterium]